MSEPQDTTEAACGRSDSTEVLERIFSGDASVDMWAEINALDALSTGDDIRNALYTICCRLQQLEAVMRSNKI